MNQFNFKWMPLIDEKEYEYLMVSTRSLIFMASIDSIYATALWEFMGDAELMESGILGVGKEITFRFTDPNDVTLVYDKKYCISSIDIPTYGTTKALQGMYSLKLISPFKYQQRIASKAYFGTISEILNQLMDKYKKKFNSLTIDPSVDERTIRYQTYQTDVEFINTRLFDAYTIDYTPAYIFITDRNNFYAKSLKTMLESASTYSVVDFSDATLAQQSSVKDSERVLSLLSLKYSLNESGTLWNKVHAYQNMVYQSNESRYAEPLFKLNSIYNTNGFLPIIRTNDPIITEVYLDDSERDTGNIYADWRRNQRSIIIDNSFTITTTTNMLVEPGKVVDLKLSRSYNAMQQTESLEESIFSSRYIIHSIQTVIQGTRSFSRCLLVRGNIIPNELSTLKRVPNYERSFN